MYQFKSRVRYSETDEAGVLSVPAIVNYMQDCSTLHSEDSGLGIRHLMEVGKAWMLTSWHIKIFRYPRLGEEISVLTWPTAFKGIYGWRDFVIRGGDGLDSVRASSLWFLFDIKNNVPIRVSREDYEAYGSIVPSLDSEPASKKLSLPESYEQKEPIRILSHYLDTNHHVNNAWYIRVAAELLARKGQIRDIRTHYRKAALADDILIPRVGTSPQGAFSVVFVSPDGEIHAAVQLDVG